MSQSAPPKSDPAAPETRTSALLGTSSVVTFVLLIALALLPMPYVVQTPGPVINTLGEIEGEPLISISGAPSHQPSGQLDLLTVGVKGGPGRALFLPDLAWAWINGEDTVAPAEQYYPLGTTRDTVSEQNTLQMTSSQDTAIAAALTQLDIDYSAGLEVVEVVPDSAADGVLEAGDKVLRIDGVPISDQTALTTAVAQGGGVPLALGIERDGETAEAVVAPTVSDDGPMLGVLLQAFYDFPFEVNFNVDGVGGPSAGTMFSLAIIDYLTEGEMTGGNHIAGTGQITESGQVFPIGGARQKAYAAHAAGADYFLSPADNCAEVMQSVAENELDSLTVVSISTLDEAQTAVEAIAAGSTDSLATCK